MNIDITQLIIPIIIFIVGFLAGFFTRDLIKDKTINSGIFVLVVVTIMWTLSMFFDITSPEYETPTLVHGLMGAIVGFFYKPLQTQKKDDNE